MTETQFAIVLGAVWLAPHIDKTYCLVMGAFFVTLGLVKLWS
jgi:hypothetical protein